MTDQNKTTKSTGTAANRTAQAAKGDAEAAVAQSKQATEKAADAAGTAGGAVATASGAAMKGVQAGRQAVESASGQVVAAATTTWTLINSRKALVMGAGAGAAVLSAGSYLVGRRSAHQSHGPVTRLTGGRI
jgi:hypothetical protein